VSVTASSAQGLRTESVARSGAGVREKAVFVVTVTNEGTNAMRQDKPAGELRIPEAGPVPSQLLKSRLSRIRPNN